MSTATTAIVLKETNHILAAYTQKSGAKNPLNSQQIEDRFFRNGLHMRFVKRRLPIVITTATPLGESSQSIHLQSLDKLSIAVGDRYLIKNGSVESIVRATGINSMSSTSPFTADLSIAIELKPSSDIPSGSSAASLDRSPADEPFQFAGRFLTTLVLPADSVDINSQPSEFVVNSGKPELVPAVLPAIANIEFSILLTGVQVKITPKPSEKVDVDIPVVCVLRTVTGDNVVSSATIPKAPQNSVTIPFPNIPSGDNLFLFMLKGFHPIWDRLPVTGKRTWTP